MANKIYAAAGSWDWDGTDTKKGLTLCAFDARTGGLRPLENVLPGSKIGFTPVQGKNGVLYTVEETKTSDGRKYGGGGYVIAAKVTDSGKIEVISRVPSLAVNPSGLALSEDGKHLIAVHHTSTKNVVTKLVRKKDGTIANKVLHDDAAIVLFRLEEDGQIGKAVDYVVPKDDHGKTPLLHSVYAVPDSDLFIICDKGEDKIYLYELEDEKLILCDTVRTEDGTNPRYGVFHPEKPIFYAVNEARTQVGTYLYDTEERSLFPQAVTELTDDPVIGMPSDVIITPDGRHLYAILRMCDLLAEMDINEEGVPVLVQNTDCGGKNARGMQMDKAGRYLYICNTESDIITQFTIQKNGRLKKKKDISLERAANLTILE